MKKTNYYISMALYIALFVLGIMQIARGLNVEYHHFEDGSGRLTYCLPFSDCNR